MRAVIYYMLWLLLVPTILAGCSNCGTVYIMPDGARCNWSSSSYGHEKFWDCNNGRRYMDPPSWKEERVCK